MLAGHATSLGDPSALITLVDGQTFCLSGRTGDFGANPTHGLFFADMRVLKQARLHIDGRPVEPMVVHRHSANGATFVGRHHHASRPDQHLLVVRRRWVGTVWHEVVEIRNYGSMTASITIELDVAADFADMFMVKEGRDDVEGEHSVAVEERELLFRWRHDDTDRRARLTVDNDDVQVDRHGFRWVAHIEPGATWRTRAALSVAIGEHWIVRHDHNPGVLGAEQRNEAWVASAPRLRSADSRLTEAYAAAINDLASLRLHDPTGRHRPVIAAGAPWYMALFGRDALITSYMSMPIDPDMALGVLEVLADLQGVVEDEASEEQPGRIVHETRQLGVDPAASARLGRYYGSVDATPLFVVVLGELFRWGTPSSDLTGLVAHADRALAWIDEYGDRDGDGFVEYLRSSPVGLVNQGWKDSVDGIRYRDGRVAEAPLALCEVQGYVYAAFVARAQIADQLGDVATAERYRGRAVELQRRFDEAFWIDELGWYAVALDADKRHVDSLTSNIGHCLWSGIVPPERARLVADRLLAPEMWTGWGIRTLASDSGGFDPMSYHCGSVWPHDVALCVAGLARCGMPVEALAVTEALLDASVEWNGRLPEFFCGFERSDIATPVPYPTSCSPQAWAAASPLLLVRTLLGLEPDGGDGLSLDPIDGAFDFLNLSGVRRNGVTFDIRVEAGRADVTRR